MSPTAARRLAFVGGGVWLLVILSVTMAPGGSGFDTSGAFRVRPNLMPLRDIAAVWSSSGERGWQLVGNAFLFVPLGVAAGVGRVATRLWVDVFAALAFALFIEFVQWWALPVRVASVDDVMLNVAGFALADAAARRLVQRATAEAAR